MLPKITYHAAERFLQRVFEMERYTKLEIDRAKRLLTKEIADIHYTTQTFPLPSFPNYKAIIKNAALVTIVPKH